MQASAMEMAGVKPHRHRPHPLPRCLASPHWVKRGLCGPASLPSRRPLHDGLNVCAASSPGGRHPSQPLGLSVTVLHQSLQTASSVLPCHRRSAAAEASHLDNQPSIDNPSTSQLD